MGKINGSTNLCFSCPSPGQPLQKLYRQGMPRVIFPNWQLCKMICEWLMNSSQHLNMMQFLHMQTSDEDIQRSCEQLQGWTHVSMFWGGGQAVWRLHCSPTHTTTCGAFHSGIFICDGRIINPDVELIATAEPVSNIHVCSGCKTSQRAEIKRAQKQSRM